jgi:sRNA-binding carbon storage regulator CsrA
MAVLKRKKQEAVIVARSGGSEQVLKVTVLGVQGDNVTLDFDVDAGLSVHSAEEWQRKQAARQTAKPKPGADRPKERAAYSD